MKERHEVDAWDEYRQRIKRDYQKLGMSEEEADEQATKDVRREIRQCART